jgi:hypothetical protein
MMAGSLGAFCAGIVVLTLVGSACGYDRGSNPTGPGYGDSAAVAVPATPALSAARLRSDQLKRAKRATARYHDVRKAVADGYVDINVVRPHMGRHFLKEGLVDAKFEVERPEVLVYSPDENGHLQLVAVEYAVPLDLSRAAPEGFEGSEDVWVPDPQFPLWTLHAWVWKGNPDGVFSMNNARVP